MSEIIVPLDYGKHNSNLDATNTRLTALGNWKKQRIVTVIPVGASIPAKVYLSHMSIVFPPNQPRVPLLVKEAEVGGAYEAGIKVILENKQLREWDYVLMLEHDNCPPTTGVLDLLKHFEAHPEYAAISGLYFTKGDGGCAQIWGDIRDPVVNYRPQLPVQGALIECYGIAQGFALYKMEMFRELERKKEPRPWFKTVADDTGVATQDLYFWTVARKHGYRCAVACDIPVGHYSHSDDIMW